MSKPFDNGNLLAFGALGLLGVASALAKKGSSNQGRCTSCGTHLRGSLKTVSVEDEGERWETSPLFLQRHDNQGGFLIPYALSEELDRGYKAFTRRAGEEYDSLADSDVAGVLASIRSLYSVSSSGKAAFVRSFKDRNPKKGKGPAATAMYNRRVDSAWAAELKKRHQQILMKFRSTPLGMSSAKQIMILKSWGIGPLKSGPGGVTIGDSLSLLDYGDLKTNGTTHLASGQSNISKTISRLREAKIKLPPALQGKTAKSVLREMSRVGTFSELSTIEPLVYIRRQGRKKVPAIRSVSMAVMKREYIRMFIGYMRMQYIKRAWTIHMMSELKSRGIDFTSARRRRAVVPRRGSGPAMFDGVTFKLQVASRPPAGLFDGSALSSMAPQTKRLAASQMSVGGAKLIGEQRLQASQTQQEEDDEADVPASVVGEPVLYLYDGSGERMTYWWITKEGGMTFVHGKSQISLLTKTSKMSSPSFGLPAYTSAKGGTCPAADLSDSRIRALSKIRGKETVICSTCYATGASYGYANNMTEQDARKRWILQLRKLDKTGEVGGLVLSYMIAGYAVDGKGSGRKGQEIGVWDSAKGVIRTAAGPATNTVIRLESFEELYYPPTTRDMFKGIPNGVLCGFFRLHDSGDFGLGVQQIYMWTWVGRLFPHLQIWTPTRVWVAPGRKSSTDLRGAAAEWYRGWVDGTCKGRPLWRLRSKGSRNIATESASYAEAGGSPGELGLADWYSDTSCDATVLPQYLVRGDVKETRQSRALSAFAALPNVACRPSGLYIKEYPDDPVTIPFVEGLSAGSGVARKYSPRAYEILLRLRSAPARQREKRIQLQAEFRSADASRTKSEIEYPPICSMADEPDAAPVRAYQCPVYTEDESGKEAKSCQAANCRACWLVHGLPVFYGAH